MLEEILKQLEQASNASVKKRYEKLNEHLPYYGVMKSDINKIAKQYKKDNKLAYELWKTKNIDAQFLGVYLFNPKKLTEKEINEIMNTYSSIITKQAFVEKVISKSSYLTKYIKTFLGSENRETINFGWLLQVKYFSMKKATTEEIENILSIIEVNLKVAEEPIKWSMNYVLVTIAITYDKYLNRCLQIAEQLEVYKEQKVAKGCTSAYAPDWIAAILKRGR